MGSQFSKSSQEDPPSGIPASFMFKNYSPSSCTFLAKWTNLTKSNLQLQWPLWGTFNIPKLVFLRTKLEDHGSKIKQTEWDAYFNWLLEASKFIQDSKIASLQNTISKLTNVSKLLKENKKASEASFPSPPPSLSLVPSSSFHSVPSSSPLYPLLPHYKCLIEFPFFFKDLPTSSSPESIKTCPFEIRL